MNDRCLVRRGSLDANKKHLSITNQSTLKVGITVKDFELWYKQNSYNYTRLVRTICRTIGKIKTALACGPAQFAEIKHSHWLKLIT